MSELRTLPALTDAIRKDLGDWQSPRQTASVVQALHSPRKAGCVRMDPGHLPFPSAEQGSRRDSLADAERFRVNRSPPIANTAKLGLARQALALAEKISIALIVTISGALAMTTVANAATITFDQDKPGAALRGASMRVARGGKPNSEVGASGLAGGGGGGGWYSAASVSALHAFREVATSPCRAAAAPPAGPAAASTNKRPYVATAMYQ